MDLETLRGFLEVAKTQNLTTAAQNLGLTQSTLSRRIGRLESSLGQPLFERTSRAMVPTELGAGFVDRARLVVSILEEAQAEFRDTPDSGSVRIGAIPTIAPYFLPGVLSRFAHAYPKATVSVREDTTAALLEACRDGQLDLIVVAEPIDSTHLDVATLYDEELLLLTPADHPLAKKKAVSISELENAPIVLLNDENCLTDAIDAFCRDRSVNLISVEQVHQLSMLQELVGLGHGISLVPKLAADRDASPDRVYRKLSTPRPTRRVVAVRNPYRFQKGVARSLWDALLDGSASAQAKRR